MCRNAKGLVLKKIEWQFREDFMMLNNYAIELKELNLGSTVIVVSEREKVNELPIFQKCTFVWLQLKRGSLLDVGG